MLNFRWKFCVVLWICRFSLGKISTTGVLAQNLPQEIPGVPLGSVEPLLTEPELNVLSELTKQIQELKSNLQILQRRVEHIEKDEDDISQISESSHKGKISIPDTFVVSRNICGEVIVGSKGQIIYVQSENSSKQIFSKGCIWTIRTGREFTKIITDSDMIEMNSLQSTAFVLEPVSGTPEMKFTRLRPGKNELFNGPLLFVWLSMTLSDPGPFTFQLEFEGLGNIPTDYKLTRFTHQSLQVLPNQKIKVGLGGTESDSKIIQEIFTLTFTFDLKTFIHFKENATKCSIDESIMIFDGFILDGYSGNISGLNCCVQNCESISGQPMFPVVAIMRNDIGKPTSLNLSMISESSYVTSEESSECGGILGGMKGVIDYKSKVQYNNNERCIWTIVPGPYPIKSVEMRVTHNGLEAHYDNLYVMEIDEITDENGIISPQAPRITNLTDTIETHTIVGGKEFYVVFYSDMWTTGSGFRIEYIVRKGTYKKAIGVNTFYQTYVQKAPQGSVSISMPSLQRQQASVAIIPKMGQNETDSVLKLHFSPEYYCDIPVYFELYLSNQGVLTKQLQSVQCASNNASTASTKDGMALVLFHFSNTSVIKSPSISWEVTDARPANVSFIKTDGKKCGGVVEADSGVIQYKPDVTLEPIEECIWTIVTKNASVNVKLIKKGSVEGSSLTVFGVDPELGTLYPTTLNEHSPDAMIFSSAVIVVFKTVKNQNTTGFALEFDASGTLKSTTTFVATHSNANNGNYSSILPPLANVGQGFSKNIQIFTHSRNDSEPKYMFMTANFQYGVYRKKETDCDYETITAYDLRLNELTQVAQLPGGKEISNCISAVAIGSLHPWFKTRSEAFITIHKTFSHMPITSFYWQPRKDLSRNCDDIKRGLVDPKSGVYEIFPSESVMANGGLQVFCDMETDGGGWTVIQRRQESTSGDEVDFYRNWDEYAMGFGNLNDSFWLGLDHVSDMTNTQVYTLRIELMDRNGEEIFAEYTFFKVADSTDFYRLSVSGYSGNAKDLLEYQNNQQFSTKDKGDNMGCANYRRGGYWYGDSSECLAFDYNLNGGYEYNPGAQRISGLRWAGKVFNRSEMKIRTI